MMLTMDGDDDDDHFDVIDADENVLTTTVQSFAS